MTRAAHTYAGVTCPHCSKPYPVDTLPQGNVVCVHCSKGFAIASFRPPVQRVVIERISGDTPLGSNLPCPNHARNVATKSCSRCGIYMCTLCSLEPDGMTLCPDCFARLSAEGALASTRTRFRDFGALGLTFAAAGIFVWFLSFILGPVAVYYGIRGVKQKNELGDVGGRTGTYVAIILGILETIGGVALVVVLIRGWND